MNKIIVMAAAAVVVFALCSSHINAQDVLFYTKKAVSRCQMKTASCDIELLVLIKTIISRQVNKDTFVAKSNADQYVRFLKVDSCNDAENERAEREEAEAELELLENANNSAASSNKKQFDKLKRGACPGLSLLATNASAALAAFNVNTSAVIVSSYTNTVLLVRLSPVLIGNASINFYYKSELESQNEKKEEQPPVFVHKVIVVGPRRLVDILFDIYIWVSNSLISLRKF
jgi:hypothetical protein